MELHGTWSSSMRVGLVEMGIALLYLKVPSSFLVVLMILTIANVTCGGRMMEVSIGVKLLLSHRGQRGGNTQPVYMMDVCMLLEVGVSDI